jgi:hypothetical protein
MIVGRSPAAGVTLGGTYTRPTETIPSLVIEIDAADVTDYYELGTLRIRDRLNAASTAEFKMSPLVSAALMPNIGERVRIRRQGAVIFDGSLQQMEVSEPFTGVGSGADKNFLNLHAADWTELADRHVIAANYEVENQTLKEVLVDIVENQGEPPGALSLDGVTTELLPTGPTVGKVLVPYMTAAKIFTELAERTGHFWYIDYYKKLRFLSVFEEIAPFNVGVGAQQKYVNARTTVTKKKYRNRQIVRGGQQVTDETTDPFKGDGENTQFTTRYPLANDDDNPPVIKVNSVTKTVGIQGKDPPEDFEWYYQKGVDKVSQRAGDTTLTDSDTLEVIYDGLIPIIFDEINYEEIAAQAAVEGSGTGAYDHVEVDKKINDINVAVERAESMLDRYDEISTRLDVTTWEHGLRAGQNLLVNLPDQGVTNEVFVLEEVGIRDRGRMVLLTDARGAKGNRYGDEIEFFRRLWASGELLTIRENEQLTIGRKKQETLTLSDSLDTSIDPLDEIAWLTDDPYTAPRIGEIDSQKAMVIGFAKIGPHPRQ